MSVMDAKEYLDIGITLFNETKYMNAFHAFKCALNMRPDFASGLEDTFAKCLCEWGKELAIQQDYVTLLKSYEDSLVFYPQNKFIIYNFGAHLLSFGHYSVAVELFKSSLKLDPTFLPPFRGLQSAKSHILERWHFRMINDYKRNKVFKDAIQSTVKLGKHSFVLDIGCGTGILSLFAIEGGAKFVHAYECNENLANYAKKIILKNRLSHRIFVINKKSTDVQQHLNISRSSMIVTETFDAALVGEGVIPSLEHALRKLCKMGSNVIPWKATLYATAVEASQLARKYKTLGMPRAQASLPELFSNGHEPYDTCNLSSVPDAVYLSSIVELFHINFQELYCLMTYKRGVSKKVKFDFIQSGFLDFIGVWFKLDLTEDISLSTHPGELTCWDQAIFPIPGSQLFQKGDSVTYEFRLREDKLTLELEKPKGVPMPSVSFLNDSHSTSDFENWLCGLKLPPGASILQVLPYPIMAPLEDIDCEVTYVVSATGVEEFVDMVDCIPNKNNKIKFRHIDELEDILANQKFHAIAINLVESCGELNESLVQLIPHFRFAMLSTDHWTCKIFPSYITVFCQLITSLTLYASSTIINDKASTNFCGFNILNEINSQQMYGLRRGELDMKPASEPISLIKLSLDKLSEDACVKYVSQVEATGPVHAIAFWFIPQDDNVESPVKGDLSSINHWADLSVQMIHPPLLSAAKTTVQIELLYRIGLVKLSARIA